MKMFKSSVVVVVVVVEDMQKNGAKGVRTR
jgi:hypothetical protein